MYELTRPRAQQLQFECLYYIDFSILILVKIFASFKYGTAILLTVIFNGSTLQTIFHISSITWSEYYAMK